MLVFVELQMAERIAALRALDVSFHEELPRGLDPDANALIESPEGTPLLLLTGES